MLGLLTGELKDCTEGASAVYQRHSILKTAIDSGVFKDQGSVHQVYRFEFNLILRQVHAMEAEVARSTVPFSGFIEIAGVQVQPHNTLGDPAIDPVESVSPAHSQYGDGGRLASLKCGSEEFRQCFQLPNFVRTHVAFVVGKRYVQPRIGQYLPTSKTTWCSGAISL